MTYGLYLLCWEKKNRKKAEESKQTLKTALVYILYDYTYMLSYCLFYMYNTITFHPDVIMITISIVC